MRVLFERLGLTYLKVGQYLALRLDLLPDEVRRDLEQLFENVSPVAFDPIRKLVEEELGAPLAANFQEFMPFPIATASIAQVHLATTASGSRVAVKVQRPGIRRAFASDVRLLLRFGRVADFFALAGAISVTEAVEQFTQWTSRELDFIQEGKTAERLSASADGNAIIPGIHWALTTDKVLTLDYIEGVSLAEVITALECRDTEWVHRQLSGVDLEMAFKELAQSCLHQIFTDGFFHGDPHPGNILITPSGRIAFVDFGIFGELTTRQRQLLRDYLGNLILGRAEESFQSYSQLFSFAADSDYRGFRRDILLALRDWQALAMDPNVPHAARLAGKFADRISGIARKHRVLMEMDLLLFWRVFIVLDAVAARLSSTMDLLAELDDFFRSADPGGLLSLHRLIKESERNQQGMAAQTGMVSKLIDQRRSGMETPVWVEEAEATERKANRDAARLASLAAGLSASVAAFAVLPAAAFLVLFGWAAAAVWLARRSGPASR